MSTLVMEGPLKTGEMDLTTVLQAVSMSRQYTVVRLEDGHGKSNGEIRLKAGHVIAASSGAEKGKEAFYRLINNRNKYFRVERQDDPSDLPDSIGTIVSLLLEAPRHPHLRPVDARANPAAGSRPPAPPSPARAQMSAPKPPSRIRPSVSPAANKASKPAAGEAGDLSDIAREIPGLRVAVVSTLPDCLRCMSWQEEGFGATWDLDALATYVSETVRLNEQCLKDFVEADDAPSLTLEIGSRVLVVHQINSELIAAFGFDRSTPLGFARLQVLRVRDRLEQKLRAATG